MNLPRREFFRQTTVAGGAAWLLPQLSVAEMSRPLFIEGYTGQTNYAPGDEVTVHVSTSTPKFSLEIARLGLKTEIVWTTKTPLPGAEHPIPENASSHGLSRTSGPKRAPETKS